MAWLHEAQLPLVLLGNLLEVGAVSLHGDGVVEGGLELLVLVVDAGGGDEHDALGDDVALAAEGDENRVVRVVVRSQELQGF